MKTSVLAALLLAAAGSGFAQEWRDRLPSEMLDVTPPSARVSGDPGGMRMLALGCRDLPADGLRRRIVDVAVQEWAYFGFSVDDQTRPREGPLPARNWRFSRLDPVEAGRVAASIGGYWAAAPNSAWILERQNQVWEAGGIASRWRDPWSAAFISWVMCESGLGDSSRFQRAIAHHSYIDQAIRARDNGDETTAYHAYDPGEAAISPGDLLCRGSRPNYRSIAQRRAQMGTGARTHCDIVVKVDEEAGRIMVIGGNVRGSVRMKLLPATRDGGEHLRPAALDRRAIFAHLRLRAEGIEADALDSSPTMLALGCGALQTPATVATLSLAVDDEGCGSAPKP